MSLNQFVDVRQVVREWALGMRSTTVKSKIDPTICIIDWSLVKIDNLEGRFEPLPAPTPKSVVIFTTTFSNRTNTAQKHSLKAERMTHSTCHVELNSGMILGGEVPPLAIEIPDDMHAVHTGFGQKMLVTQSRHQTFSEELKWTVDSIVTVQPHTTSEAQVKIEEETRDTEFGFITQLSGKIRVTFKHEATGEFTQHVDGDIAVICKNSTETSDYVKRSEKGLVVQILTSGRLTFNYAIQQHVSVTDN